MKSRSAFSLFELLVALAIVAILIAILMPALHSARDAARRLQCTSNFRQLGIAIKSYEAQFSEYPPASTVSPKRHSLLTFLLPYIDQQSVHDRYDWREHWNSAANRPATQAKIKTFRCPSTPGDAKYTTDYAACLNIVAPARRELLSNELVTARRSWLSMLQNTRTTSMMIVDGMSNTYMLFEDAGRPRKYELGYRKAGKAKGSLWADAHSAFLIHRLCRGTSLMNCRNDNEIYSFHKAGCNFLYGDGSVHFVTEDIAPEIFVSRFTREAGDLAVPRAAAQSLMLISE